MPPLSISAAAPAVIAAVTGIRAERSIIRGVAEPLLSFATTGVGLVTGGSGRFSGTPSIANTASNDGDVGSDDESLGGAIGKPLAGSDGSASELSKLGKPVLSETVFVMEEETFIGLSRHSAPKNRVAECHRITMARRAKRNSRSNAGMEL